MNLTKFDEPLVGRTSDGENTEITGIMFDDGPALPQLNIHALDGDGLPSFEVLALPHDPEVIRKISTDLAAYADWLSRGTTTAA